MDFDRAVLDQLDKWIRTKGGRVQAKLINEFYQKNQPTNKQQLFGKLHLLADCPASTVHLVGNAYNVADYLELKHLGSKPFRPAPASAPAASAAASSSSSETSVAVVVPSAFAAEYPAFVKQSGYQYALVRTAGAVRAVVDKWQQEYACLAFDFKGDIRGDGKVALMQVSTNDYQILMIDLADNRQLMLDSGMKAYFEDATKIKVILDSARSVEALRTLWGINMVNVYDLSRAFIITKLGYLPPDHRTKPGASLVEMVREFNFDFPRVNKPDDANGGWFKRPLSQTHLEYAAKGVVLNCHIYEVLRARSKSMGLDDVCAQECVRYMRSLYGKKTVPSQQGGGSGLVIVNHHPQAAEFEPNWTCTRCTYVNFAKRTQCKSCDASKPKRAVLQQQQHVQLGMGGGGQAPQHPPASAAAAQGAALSRSARERQVDQLLQLGLTPEHCYYYHVEGNCVGDLGAANRGCRFVHDQEVRTRHLAEAKKRAAQSQKTEAQRLQEAEDEAMERAMQESLRSEEERLERQRKQQDEEMLKYQRKLEEEQLNKTKAKQAELEAQAKARLLEQKAAAAAAKPQAVKPAPVAVAPAAVASKVVTVPPPMQQHPQHQHAQPVYQMAPPQQQQHFQHYQQFQQYQQYQQYQQQQQIAVNSAAVAAAAVAYQYGAFPPPPAPAPYSYPPEPMYSSPPQPPRVPIVPAPAPVAAVVVSSPPPPEPASSAPVTAAAAATDAPQTPGESHMLLSMEIGMILSELKMSAEWADLVTSCAEATGGVSEMRDVNLVKFAKALAEHINSMPMADQSKFIREVYKRRTKN